MTFYLFDDSCLCLYCIFSLKKYNPCAFYALFDLVKVRDTEVCV